MRNRESSGERSLAIATRSGNQWCEMLSLCCMILVGGARSGYECLDRGWCTI